MNKQIQGFFLNIYRFIVTGNWGKPSDEFDASTQAQTDKTDTKNPKYGLDIDHGEWMLNDYLISFRMWV